MRREALAKGCHVTVPVMTLARLVISAFGDGGAGLLLDALRRTLHASEIAGIVPYWSIKRQAVNFLSPFRLNPSRKSR